MDRKTLEDNCLGPSSYHCSECGERLKVNSIERYCPKCGLVDDDAPVVNPQPDKQGLGYSRPNRLTGLLEPTIVSTTKKRKLF